jgi:hypothetical protein
MFSRLKQIINRNPAIAGLPIIGICFGGLYAITIFQEGRFERVDFMVKSQTEEEFNLQEELDTILQKMDISSYKPIPIPNLNGTSRVNINENNNNSGGSNKEEEEK